MTMTKMMFRLMLPWMDSIDAITMITIYFVDSSSMNDDDDDDHVV